MRQLKEFMGRSCWDVPMPVWVVYGLCWGYTVVCLIIFIYGATQ